MLGFAWLIKLILILCFYEPLSGLELMLEVKVKPAIQLGSEKKARFEIRKALAKR